MVSIAKAKAGIPPVNVDVMPSLTALWGWFLSNLPGKRHRKLLVRSLVADNAYIEITKKIKSVWNARA
jgi:hypothetical protein